LLPLPKRKVRKPLKGVRKDKFCSKKLLLLIVKSCKFSGLERVERNSVLVKLLSEQRNDFKKGTSPNFKISSLFFPHHNSSRLRQSSTSKLVNWLLKQSSFRKLVNPCKSSFPSKFFSLIVNSLTLVLFSGVLYSECFYLF